jgi:hypothetical protein
VSHDIRVDANQNRDFTDDAVMRPYKEKFDIGHFGTDKRPPRSWRACRSSWEYREDVDLTPAGLPGEVADFVSIGIPEGLHGSHVAASPPVTTCSATRTSTARRPAPRSSRRGPARGPAAAPRPH